MSKGIVLAGGNGTRLHPMTTSVSKQLLPVYDKPMVHYSLSTLMLAGLRDILVITTPRDRELFERLLGDGSDLGIRITYAVQDAPRGIAEALIIGAEFIDGDRVGLVLGDNLYHGQGLSGAPGGSGAYSGATVFAYRVGRSGQVWRHRSRRIGKPTTIVEKPSDPPSNLAVTGLYFYDERAVDVARSLTPSGRGELEITDVNRWYLDRGELTVEVLSRGTAWFDAGTPDSLLSAATYMQAIEQRVGLKVGCLEEVAYRMGFIDHGALMALADRLGGTDYGVYLAGIEDD